MHCPNTKKARSMDSMTNNPLDDVLELEDEFYSEGYEAGIADSAYAGMIEGKVFGIEKGYEKAFELGKLHGRALVWQARAELGRQSSMTYLTDASKDLTLTKTAAVMNTLPQNSRLRKHIDSLISVSGDQDISKDNSDTAVSEFDDKLAKARTKAKLIANITGEQLTSATVTDRGIEDATGLNART